MKKIQIYLDDAQDSELRQWAAATGVTKSALIRTAIDRFLRHGPSPSPRDLAAVLNDTYGALPGLSVPDRDEWSRSKDEIPAP